LNSKGAGLRDAQHCTDTGTIAGVVIKRRFGEVFPEGRRLRYERIQKKNWKCNQKIQILAGQAAVQVTPPHHNCYKNRKRMPKYTVGNDGYSSVQARWLWLQVMAQPPVSFQQQEQNAIPLPPPSVVK